VARRQRRRALGPTDRSHATKHHEREERWA